MKPQPKNKSIRLSTRKLKVVKDQAWDRDKGLCQICGTMLSRDFVLYLEGKPYFPEIHHVIFKSHEGGDDTIQNLLLACNNCHKIIHDGPHRSAEFRKRAEKRMKEINRRSPGEMV